uniref:Uncharacterized protein n=1 Tax=Romanomermis culicivorax TaxID=13658 RepID=A0A915JT60_ROMCU
MEEQLSSLSKEIDDYDGWRRNERTALNIRYKNARIIFKTAKQGTVKNGIGLDSGQYPKIT